MTIQRNLSLGVALSALALLSACGGKSTDQTAATETAISKSKDAVVGVTRLTSSDPTNFTAVDGATVIPYPLYPNGIKYRVGGENGLKIVLFETTDTFEEVDEFYRNMAADTEAMPRLHAMSDYVRYSVNQGDVDPWATSKPGIVIHRFNDDTERDAVGADKSARTNIILSF